MHFCSELMARLVRENVLSHKIIHLQLHFNWKVDDQYFQCRWPLAQYEV